MFLMAHLTGYETTVLVATFVFGVLTGVFGTIASRWIQLNRPR
jgi:hypothetical protein